MKNYCPITDAPSGGIGNRSAWGVDLNRNNTIGTLFDGYAGASTSLHERDLHGPVRGDRGRDQERALDRRHVQGHQVREQHPHARRLLHVGAGRVHLAGPRHAAGAEHRHRAVLLRGRGHDPVAHQVVAWHGDPAAAHGPDRGRALLGGGQLRRRELVQARHHRLLVRGRRPADHGQPDDRRDHAHGRRLPAVLRRPWARRAARARLRRPTRCWSTRATTRRWSSPRATSARSRARWSTTNDVTPPATTIEYAAAADDAALRSTSSSTGSTSRRSSSTRPDGTTPTVIRTTRRPTASKAATTCPPAARPGATTARARAVRARC